METAVDFTTWIDTTHFGTVRRYLRSAKSPITGVLFAASRALLAEVANLLDDGSERSPALRQRQLERLEQTGQLRVGAEVGPHGASLAMNCIADDTPCEVIYMPPVSWSTCPDFV